MTLQEIQDAAVQTAARIALTVGLVGCAEDPHQPDPEPDLDVDAAMMSDASVADPDAELADAELSDVEWPEPDAALIADAIADPADGAAPDMIADAGPTDDIDCVNWSGAPDEPSWEEAFEACCGDEPSESSPPLCSPWGPPTPPSMESADD